MRVKSTILLLISLPLIFTQKIQAVEPTSVVIGISYAIKACSFAVLAYSYYFGQENKKITCPCCLGTCSCVIEDPEISQRKKDCARYREAIKEFEKTLQENANTKDFYSYTLLAPVAYVRNVAGYDEKLRASNGQTLREIYHFRELLRENYCTGVEKK
jgi:hypothetical protein